MTNQAQIKIESTGEILRINVPASVKLTPQLARGFAMSAMLMHFRPCVVTANGKSYRLTKGSAKLIKA